MHESRASKIYEDKGGQVGVSFPELVSASAGEGPIAVGIGGPGPPTQTLGVNRPEKPGQAGVDEGLM